MNLHSLQTFPGSSEPAGARVLDDSRLLSIRAALTKSVAVIINIVIITLLASSG